MTQLCNIRGYPVLELKAIMKVIMFYVWYVVLWESLEFIHSKTHQNTWNRIKTSKEQILKKGYYHGLTQSHITRSNVLKVYWLNYIIQFVMFYISNNYVHIYMHSFITTPKATKILKQMTSIYKLWYRCMQSFCLRSVIIDGTIHIPGTHIFGGNFCADPDKSYNWKQLGSWAQELLTLRLLVWLGGSLTVTVA